MAQEDEEAGDELGNPRQALLRMQEKPEVGERGMGGISATLPLCSFLSSFQFSIPSLESIWDKDRGSFLESATSSNEPYSITQGDALRQDSRLRRLTLPAVGIQDKLHSQVRETLGLFELRWRVWMDSEGCWLH